MAMKHPFEALKLEYAGLLASVQITKAKEVDSTAHRLLGYLDRYKPVSEATGIPIIWIASSFEREASSRFDRSPAQGDPWNKPSVNVPKGRGPFKSWEAAALDAYKLNALDKVGAANWSWELACFYGELFNGFGYRDYRGIHSPYLWGGTNHQQKGKYTSDGKYDPDHFDAQLGTVAMMKRMVQLVPSLDLRNEVVKPSAAAVVSQPTPVGVGGAGGTPLSQHKWGAAEIQAALNKIGVGPKLLVDANYGRMTWLAVRNYQMSRHLAVDGWVGPETIASFEKDLAA
jgi:lysozyme family protein